MLKPVCLNYQHEIILKNYLLRVENWIAEVTDDKTKFNNFIEVANIIIEHHNNYKSEALGVANYSDFMSIIPTHFTCMINGYLAGLENEKNRNDVRLYKHIISEQSYSLVEKLEDIKFIYE